MESGILAEIPEFELTYNYSWDDFTTIYDKFGYYMFFEKGKMTVMLRQADMPAGLSNLLHLTASNMQVEETEAEEITEGGNK